MTRKLPASAMSALFVLAATPASALEYDARFESLLAFSASAYDPDVGESDENGHSNGSWAGGQLSVSEGQYELFGVYQYGFERFNESIPNATPGNREREAYGGVKTPYGVLGYGRQISFFRRAGRDLDPFHDTSVAGFNGVFAAEGASYGLSNLTNAFNDETVAYASPSYRGLSFNANYFLDAAGDADEDYGIGLVFAPEDGPISTSVHYLDSDGGDAVFGVGKRVPFEAVRVTAAYQWSMFSVGASYEWVDVSNESDPRNYSIFTGSWSPRSDLTVAVALGVLRDVVPNAAANANGIDGEGLTAGVFYELYPRLTIYGAARAIDLDSGNDSQSYAVGASYLFSYDLINMKWLQH